MAEIQRTELADWFGGATVTRDDTGCLALAAGLLAPLAPSLLLVADRGGQVLGADDLGSGFRLDAAVPLARQLAAVLAGGDQCLIDGGDVPRGRLAFAVRLAEKAQDAFWGGLIEASDAAGPWLESERGRLAVQGTMVWESLQRRTACARLETQVRQLRAEQRTLRASHAQLLVNAVQEHEDRLSEQRKLTAQLEAVMATAADGIITIDDRGEILSFNEAAAKVFACARDHALGREVVDLLVAPAHRRRLRVLFQKLRQRGPGAVLGGMIRVWAIRQTGEEFPAELSISSLVFDDHWQAVLVVRDITQRERREEELEAHRARLEELVAERTASLARTNTRLQQEVDERRRAEDALRQRRALLEAINRVLQETLVCESAEEVARICLSSAQELTGSPFGWIGRLNGEGRLDILAVSDTRWHVHRDLELDGSLTIRNVELWSYWQRVVTDRESIVDNQPGMHPYLTSVLGVPLLVAGRAVGMIALANKPSGYTPPDQRLIETLSVAFVQAVGRKRAEQALRDSERNYRLLAENTKDVIWTSDLALSWTYVSPSVELLRGYTAAEAMTQPAAQILSPESARVALLALAEELTLAEQQHDAATRIRTLELEVNRKDGSTVWTEVKMSFLCNDAGEPVGLMGVMRDISERRRAEHDLRAYASALESANLVLEEFNQAAQAATRAKSEFLANMSHEIRTPLTAILGFTDLMLEHKPPAENVEPLATIKRNGEYLLEILNDILDLSKIEAGRMQVERIRCSPRQLVADVAFLMKVRADAKGLPLEAQFDGPLPETILTDPTRLRQVLINVVGNAIKFTEAGGVRIRTSYSLVDGSPQLRIDVADTGIGMTDAQVARLFQPFTQADSSTSRRYGGTGLGLAISQRLSGMLGGRIAVASTPGQGSTFTITIGTGPLEGIRMLDGADPVRNQAAARQANAGPAIRLDGRILLVEDGPDNQRLISLLLRKAGAEVTVAENGWEALKIVLGPDPDHASGPAEHFDVILMDMQMPVMDGCEATRRLRRAGYCGPIIAISAHAMPQAIRECMDAGCDAHLAKPIDRAKLLAAITEQTGRLKCELPSDCQDA